MFYEFYINKTSFAGLNWGKNIVHQSHVHPYKSTAFSPMFSRGPGNETKGRMDMCYNIIEIQRLEPYKTNCKYYCAGSSRSYSLRVFGLSSRVTLSQQQSSKERTSVWLFAERCLFAES